MQLLTLRYTYEALNVSFFRLFFIKIFYKKFNVFLLYINVISIYCF